MITRSQSGIVKPIDRLSLNTFLISPIPKNPSDSLKDPKWRNAMYDEYNALVKNGTWLLVPRPTSVNMVRFMWLFKHKFHAGGTLSRYKARLVANGSSQQLGVDFTETISPLSYQPLFARSISLLCLVFLTMVSFAETLYGAETSTRASLLQQLIDSLHRLFLSQRKYALQLLERAHMVNCNPSRTLVDLLQQICLYMHDPREPHLALTPGGTIKRILRYVQGTLDLGLHLYASSTTSLVGYTDADWDGCPSTRSAEAEYRGVANVVAETAWLRNLLRELHSLLSTATLVYCDNVSAD
ncbi:ribonuclease H-like domain-containing protein [Tanacetum coccineum]|uniref:Ribonuclease H-like domain-containing protein n=1 Tax=Tanacetum coccineum TaxID=301880 RepID=A0ABQ5AHS4_9ASTR